MRCRLLVYISRPWRRFIRKTEARTTPSGTDAKWPQGLRICWPAPEQALVQTNEGRPHLDRLVARCEGMESCDVIDLTMKGGRRFTSR